MACQQVGGGWNFFSTFGWSTRSPFSRQGLAFVFHSVVFVCVLCFDSLRVFWHVLFGCFCDSLSVAGVRMQDPGF